MASIAANLSVPISTSQTMKEPDTRPDYSDIESRRSSRTRREMTPGRRAYYFLGTPVVRFVIWLFSVTYRVQKIIGEDIADRIIAVHPEIDRWVISGHSVGGAMAAQYTHTHSESIAGLVIWASYPPDKADLSGLEIPVTLIYGSREISANLRYKHGPAIRVVDEELPPAVRNFAALLSLACVGSEQSVLSHRLEMNHAGLQRFQEIIA